MNKMCSFCTSFAAGIAVCLLALYYPSKNPDEE